MNIYCTIEFKDEFNKLMRKNSYKTLEAATIAYFFAQDLTIEDLKSGVNLIKNQDNPFIKKRINGSGGFRCYYYVKTDQKSVYIVFVHPKTGKFGYENTSTGKRKELIKNLIQCIKSNELLILKSKAGKLEFEEMKE